MTASPLALAGAAVAATLTDAGIAVYRVDVRRGPRMASCLAGLTPAGADRAIRMGAELARACEVREVQVKITRWVVVSRAALPVASLLLAIMVELIAAAHVPVKATRTRKVDARPFHDPLPGMWTTYGPQPAPVVAAPRKRKLAARPPATATADAARAIAAAEPGLPRVEIARRLGVHPAQVSRALGATTTAARNGAAAHVGEVDRG